MSKRYYTIGMAGHIDHGKTALTKALTNVDTDRLKEEKERQITIELGFAPLYEDDKIQISVIDVPGHERFIRQMIAGVAGIDFVILVVAADEGVMPQTLEHAEILSLLNIENGIIVLTKIDKVDDEMINLAKEDIYDRLQGTIFEKAEIFPVSNITGEGCERLKEAIIYILQSLPQRPPYGDFRLPIDQVFTIKGQGTIVRGTIYEGSVTEGDRISILPNEQQARVRQIQVHQHQVKTAYAGQRTALNIAGVQKEWIKRGDTLVNSSHFVKTSTIDVVLKTVKHLKFPMKQRMQIKCHIGTTEVMGKLIFFDRNEVVTESEEILCQLRLDSPIVAKRGDRFIMRRPSPFETIGGGWIIDPIGKKYKFGHETIVYLQKKKEGSTKERLLEYIFDEKATEKNILLNHLSISKQEFEETIHEKEWIIYNDYFVTHVKILQMVMADILKKLEQYHDEYPLRQGMSKAELIQLLQSHYPLHLIEFSIEKGLERQNWVLTGPLIRITQFHAHLPKQWETRITTMLANLKKDEWKVESLLLYLENAGINSTMINDLINFLISNGIIIHLQNSIYWHSDIFKKSVLKLRNHTEKEFDTQEAKSILGFSRKYLVPFLEALDDASLTKRTENGRVWL